MGEGSRGLLGDNASGPSSGGEAGAILGERREGGPATFGHQPITSGSPPLFNFAQISYENGLRFLASAIRSDL